MHTELVAEFQPQVSQVRLVCVCMCVCGGGEYVVFVCVHVCCNYVCAVTRASYEPLVFRERACALTEPIDRTDRQTDRQPPIQMHRQ